MISTLISGVSLMAFQPGSEDQTTFGVTCGAIVRIIIITHSEYAPHMTYMVKRMSIGCLFSTSFVLMLAVST